MHLFFVSLHTRNHNQYGKRKKTENGIKAMDAKSEYDGDGDTSDRSDTIF